MKKFFYYAILLLPLFGWSQERKVELQWIENDSMLSFSGATYHEQSGSAPVYSLVIPWNNPAKIPSISLTINQSSLLNSIIQRPDSA